MGKEILGAIGGVAGGIINALGSGAQHKRQKEYLDIQQKNNLALMEQEQKNKMDIWNNTNYEAQIEHMKNAGLNPGLMYGMSGGGGTASGGGGGGAGLATATNPNLAGGMSEGMGIMAQSALLGAQIENIKADTKEKEANAEGIGANTELTGIKIDDIKQDITNKKAIEIATNLESKLKEIAIEIGEGTKEININRANWEADKAYRELNLLTNEQYISDETLDQKIKIVNESVTQMYLNNMLLQENIQLSKEQQKEIREKILQGWAQQDTNARNANTSELEYELKKMMPTISQISGATIKNGIQNVYKTIDKGIEMIKGRKEISREEIRKQFEKEGK